MKKLTHFFVIAAAVIFFTGCQGGKASDVPEMVEAEIMIPEKMEAGESHELKVRVTQGGDIVQDASIVEFEIWESGSKEDSEMIKAPHDGKGIYKIDKTFDHDGTYYVQTHVTAKDMHVMPKASFTIGQAEEHEEEQTESEHHHHH
ncbi:FixH family protein [Metabacillus sp. 84]|uniref:FixH family protein n=1 Tax=Metabacillus sp. 84 TaxID=3404705 RepID=UPI003CEC2116